MIIDTKKAQQAILKAWQKTIPDEPLVMAEGKFVSITPYALADIGRHPFRTDVFKDLTKAYSNCLGVPKAENEADMTDEITIHKGTQYRKVVRKLDKRVAWLNVEVMKFISKNSKPKWYLVTQTSLGGRDRLVVQASEASTVPYVELMSLALELKEGEGK